MINSSRIFYKRKLATIAHNARELSVLYEKEDPKRSGKYARWAKECDADLAAEDAKAAAKGKPNV